MLKLLVFSPHMRKDWLKQSRERELLDPAKCLVTCILCNPYHLDTARSSHSFSVLDSTVHPKHPQVLRASTWLIRRQKMRNPGPLPNSLTRFTLSKFFSHTLPETQPPPQRCGILFSSNLPGREHRSSRITRLGKEVTLFGDQERSRTHQQIKASRKVHKANCHGLLQPWLL